MISTNSYYARWIILSFTPCFLSESAFDFAVLSIELSDNIGSVLPWQQLPKIISTLPLGTLDQGNQFYYN